MNSRVDRVTTDLEVIAQDPEVNVETESTKKKLAKNSGYWLRGCGEKTCRTYRMPGKWAGAQPFFYDR